MEERTKARALGIVSIVFALVLQTAPAWADDAWALWREEMHYFLGYRSADVKTDQDENQSWNIVGAYTKKSDCDTQQKAEIEGLLKQWRNQPGGSSVAKTAVDYTAGGNTLTKTIDVKAENYTSTARDSVRYLCLPGTIDPRGPKR